MDSGNITKQKGKALDEIVEVFDGDEACVDELVHFAWAVLKFFCFCEQVLAKFIFNLRK